MRTALLSLFVLMASAVRAADYNIVSYGAKNDTTVLSTKAVQQAIDDCSKAGGGTDSGYRNTDPVLVRRRH